MNLSTHYENLENEYPTTSPRYSGDSLDESEKLRIRENIAKSKSILDSMSEIEKTALALQNIVFTQRTASGWSVINYL